VSGTSARKGRAKRARFFRFTREGKVFVGVTFGVGVAAVNTGNNLLYLVLGLMLSTLLLSGVLSELALRRVRLRRRLPSRAFVGSPCLVAITLSNGKRHLPSFSLEAEDRAQDEVTDRRCYFLKVRAGGEQTAAYRRVPSRRGVLRLKGFRLSTRYPFGLVQKIRTIDRPAELLVYPALAEGLPASPAARPSHGMTLPSGAIGHGTEIAGLREHRPEDEARSIHWRRTAALGRLVVREHERETSLRRTLVLDNARPDDADEAWDAAFEQTVSEAASLAARALAEGAATEVRTRTGSSPVVLPGSPPDPIWRYLALLETVELADAPALPSPRGPGRVIHLGPARRTTEGAA
jgi:uncharacterized protein (DUF58 family)